MEYELQSQAPIHVPHKPISDPTSNANFSHVDHVFSHVEVEILDCARVIAVGDRSAFPPPLPCLVLVKKQLVPATIDIGLLEEFGEFGNVQRSVKFEVRPDGRDKHLGAHFLEEHAELMLRRLLLKQEHGLAR